MKKKWNLPPNWNWIPLSDLISDMSGGTWGTDDDLNGTAVLRPNNIGLDGYVIFEDLRFREIPLGQLKKQKLMTGDVILTKSNSLEQVGRCAFFVDPNDGKSYVASNFLQRLRFDENRVNPKYGFWFLYSQMAREYFQSQAKGSSASLKNLTSDVISSLEFPIPSFEDQSFSLRIQNQIVERIEALFVELSEAHRLHEKIVADTNRLMDAVLADYFPRLGSTLPDGWEWKKLGDESLLEIIMGQSPPGDSYNDEGKGLPFFQGKTDFRDYYPTPRKWCTAPTKISLPGDVLISVRAPVGPTNLTAEKCAIGRGLTILRPKPTLNTKFLLFALRSLESQISKMGKGSTFAAITKTDLEHIEIPYTDPDNQTRVVTQVERFNEKLAEAQLGNNKTGNLLNQMEQSILAQAFRGEL